MKKFNVNGKTVDVFSLIEQGSKENIEVTILEASLVKSENGSVGIKFKADSRRDVEGNPTGFLNSYIYLGKSGDSKPSKNFVNLSNALGLPLGFTKAESLVSAIIGKHLKLYVSADDAREYNGKYYVNYSIIWINPTDFPEVKEVIAKPKAEEIEVPELDWL